MPDRAFTHTALLFEKKMQFSSCNISISKNKYQSFEKYFKWSPPRNPKLLKRYKKKSNKPIVIFLHFLDGVLLPSHRKFGKGFWSMELGKSPFIHTDRSTVFTVHERIEVPSRNT